MSRSVKAQREANATNLQIAHETNSVNRDIAQQQNEYNYRMFNEQNQWNLEQWNRENEYNSPSAQMQRYLEAGINPLWAMQSGDAGQAQHLTSADAKDAVGARMIAPHVAPEYDPTQLNNIVAASRDLANSALGWSKLGLESQDVETRRASQISRSALDYASAANKRASTTQLETETAWNLDTFGVRVEQEQQKLSNMRKQLDLMDSQSDNYKAAAANYRASEDLVREKINRIAEDYQLRWKEIDIAIQNAASNRMGAEASVQNAATASHRLQFDERFAEATVAKWNNDQLLDYLKSFSQNISGELKGGVSVGDVGISGKAGVSEKGLPTLTTFQAAGLRAIQWSAQEPSNPKAAEAARIAVEITDKIDNNVHVPYAPGASSSNTSVLNPPGIDTFGSWSSWQ